MANPMMLKTEELQVLKTAMDEYRKYFEWIVETLRKDFRPANLDKTSDWNDPATLNRLSLWNQVEGEARQKIGSVIREQTQYSGTSRAIPFELLPIIKRGYLYWRRQHVRKLEILKRNAIDVEFNQKVNREIGAADLFLPDHLFHAVTPAPMVRLTDFVTLQRAEELLNEQGKHILPPKKEYDGKFGILSPSSSVTPELEYWREQCDLRGVGLALAYMDIDNFKADFNSKYTETLIDLECLPAIMRRIEAHAFNSTAAFCPCNGGSVQLQ